MNFKEYWNRLELEIKKFDVSDTKASSPEDNKEFEKQKKTLLDVITIVEESEQYWDPRKKKDCLDRIENLINNEQTFGKNGHPNIVGNKTRDFIENVYIPHLRRQPQIDFGAIATIAALVLKLAGKGETVAGKIQKSLDKANNLEKNIQKYDTEKQKEQHNLLSRSPTLFAQATSQPLDVKPAEQEKATFAPK